MAPYIQTVITKKEISNFNAFPIDFVMELAAENKMLEMAINYFLQSGKVKGKCIESVIKGIGMDWFTKCEDGTYIWKGI